MAWGNLATLHVALWLRPGLPPGGPPAALDAPPPASPPMLAAPAAAACPTPATRRRTTASMNLSLRFQARLRVLPNIGSALPYAVAVDNSAGLHRCWKAATLVPPASRARAEPPPGATLVQTRAASRAQPACDSLVPCPQPAQFSGAQLSCASRPRRSSASEYSGVLRPRRSSASASMAAATATSAAVVATSAAQS